MSEDPAMMLELALRNIGQAGEEKAYQAFRGAATALGNITGKNTEELAKFIFEALREAGHVLPGMKDEAIQ